MDYGQIVSYRFSQALTLSSGCWGEGLLFLFQKSPVSRSELNAIQFFCDDATASSKGGNDFDKVSYRRKSLFRVATLPRIPYKILQSVTVENTFFHSLLFLTHPPFLSLTKTKKGNKKITIKR